jgi:hypothetical protein
MSLNFALRHPLREEKRETKRLVWCMERFSFQKFRIAYNPLEEALNNGSSDQE